MTTFASIILYALSLLFAAGSAAMMQEGQPDKVKMKEARPGIVITVLLFVVAAALQVTA